MLDPRALTELERALVNHFGGFLRNPIREPLVTCEVCTTPAPTYRLCYPCMQHRQALGEGLADATGFMTYATKGTQAGYVMHGYKAAPPVREHVQVVTLLALVGVARHSSCAATLVGLPLTHWSFVPSLPAKAGAHPLHAMVRSAASGREVPLTAAARVDNRRGVRVGHFTAQQIPAGAHVLLVDDTWTSGGHVQSAALALRAAGAGAVSALVLARWLSPEREETKHLIRTRLARRDYDVRICPWTGSSCP